MTVCIHGGKLQNNLTIFLSSVYIFLNFKLWQPRPFPYLPLCPKSGELSHWGQIKCSCFYSVVPKQQRPVWNQAVVGCRCNWGRYKRYFNALYLYTQRIWCNTKPYQTKNSCSVRQVSITSPCTEKETKDGRPTEREREILSFQKLSLSSLIWPTLQPKMLVIDFHFLGSVFISSVKLDTCTHKSWKKPHKSQNPASEEPSCSMKN